MGCHPLFDIPPKMHCMTHESSSSAVKFDHVSNVPVLQGKKIEFIFVRSYNEINREQAHIPSLQFCLTMLYTSYVRLKLSNTMHKFWANEKSIIHVIIKAGFFSPENEQISVNHWKGITADLYNRDYYADKK